MVVDQSKPTFREQAELCTMEDALAICNIPSSNREKFKISCPFHSERTPSCSINLITDTWRCFGQCNKGGDPVDFVQTFFNISNVEALKKLRGDHANQLSRSRLNPRRRKRMREKKKADLEVINDAYNKFKEDLETSPEAQSYLTSRGLTNDTMEKQGFAFASARTDIFRYLLNQGYEAQRIKDSGLFGQYQGSQGVYPYFKNMVILPYMDADNNIVLWMTGRSIKGKQFMHLGGDKPIFGMANLQLNYPIALCVEGAFDYAIARQAKAVPAIAVMGGHDLEAVPRELKKRNIGALITAFDNDEAGQEYTQRLLPCLDEAGIEHAEYPFPEKLDNPEEDWGKPFYPVLPNNVLSS